MTMRNYTRISLLLICTFWGNLSWSAPILSVSGNANGFDTFFAGDVFGFSFQLGQDMSDVSIAAAVDCINCDGQVFLTNHLADTGRLGIVDLWQFTDLSASASYQSLFSGLSLAADLYFVTFQLNAGSNPVGWITANPSVETGAFGASHGFDFQAILPNQFAPHSQGISILNQGGGFLFDITGRPSGTMPPVSVPEPTSLVLLFGAGALLLLRRRPLAAPALKH